MSNIEALFLGVNDVGMRIYEWLCDRDSVEVLGLITTKDQLKRVNELEPDILVSVGYNHLVTPDILDVPDMGSINLHPSLLPYGKGKSPNVWSIVEDTPAGVTLHYMDEDFDTGEIIAQREVSKSFEDNGKDLHRRLERASYELFVENWPSIEAGDAESRPQEPGGEFRSVDDFKELCHLDPDETYTVKEILDILRALTFPPFDNASVELDGDRYYVDVDIRKGESGSDREGLLESY